MLDFNKTFFNWERSLVGVFGIFAGIVSLLSGCSSVPQIETPIHESPKGRVILKTFTEPSKNISHPTVIDLELLTETLRGLRVQEQKQFLDSLVSGEGQTRSVFSEKEIQFLAPFIINAFTKATPEEYVLFQSLDQNQSRSTSTSGIMYLSNNLLQVGLNEFEADSRYTRLSSKPSFSPRRLQHWTLEFYPAEANHQANHVSDTFSTYAQLGSVAIALNALHNVKHSQKVSSEKGTQSHLRSKNQGNEADTIQKLKDEIDELQQQLEGQNKKLRQLENKLEENTAE